MRLVIIVLFLASCRAPEPLRDKAKAQRLISKIERLDPSALTQATDTVFQLVEYRDTLYVTSRYYDTTFLYQPGDTVTITDTVTQTVAQVIFRDRDATVSIYTPSDTILIHDSIFVPVQVHTTTINKRPLWAWLMGIWRTGNWLIIIGVVLLGVWWAFRLKP